MMTVAELIEQLEALDPEAEVRIAVQPTYPFEHRLDEQIAEVDGKVYLAEAHQQGYLPDEVREALGW